MGIAKLLTDRVAGFWSKEYDIKDFTLSSVAGDIYTFRLNANTFSLDISYDKTNKVITDYVVVSGELIDNESLLMLNLTDLISKGIMNSEVSDTVFTHVEFVNASIAKYLEIINTASALRDVLDNKNTTLLSTITTAVNQTDIIEQITNSISSASLDIVANDILLIKTASDNIDDIVTISADISKGYNANNIQASSSLLSIATNFDKVVNVNSNMNRLIAVSDGMTAIETVSIDLYNGANSEIRKVNLLKSNIDKVVTLEQTMDNAIALETKMDYTKNTLETKMNNVISLETKILDITSEPLRQSIIDAEDNAETATTKASEASVSANSSRIDMWIAEAQKLTADSYATEPENVLVKLYTSNGDGTFSYTNSTEYSSLHWATKAQELVTDGVIDDVTPSTLRTYSSNKIEAELLERDNLNASQQSDINGLIASILALNTANAQGQFGGTSTIALSSTEQVLPFSVITQSTDTTAFEIGTNTGTIKEAGSYNFISTVVFEDTGANGVVGTVTFNLRDTTTNTIYYTQTTTTEISGFDRDTIPFNSLMVIPDTMTLPITIDINVSCNITGYSIVGFNSLLTQAGGSVQTIDIIDSALGSLITGVLV